MQGPFDATYTQGADGWLVRAVVGEAEVAEHGRTLERARANVTSAIAKRLKTYSVTVTDHFELARPALKGLGDARAARNAALEAAARSRIATSEAVAALMKEGLSVRDCGYLLGISHSRVQQIIEELEREGRKR